MNDDNVPMMFRAPIEGRCQIQRVIDKRQHADKRQDAEKWVDEWKEVFPQDSLPQEELPNNKFVSNSQQSNNRAFARPKQNNQALSRPKPSQKASQNSNFKLPKFGSQVKKWEYTINWRLVSNSGQYEGVILPIIGARGCPYFSGASMKGAFIRACKQLYGKEKGKIVAENYCGRKLSYGSSEPGILRFHGAYPVDMNWMTKRLVDIVHNQQDKQVIEDCRTNANSQISLHQTKLEFGISSTKDLEASEWEKIKNIWERALADGIGSRVSAGYGYFQEVNHLKHSQQLLQIKLKGQGGVSQLISKVKGQKISEFRPNMFKAALRGHTLRLLGGLTDKDTAKEITEKLWGGFGTNKSNGSVVGYLGIDFDYQSSSVISENNPGHYQLSEGALNIFRMNCQIDNTPREKLIKTAEALVKFSMLFGGFGKSWRRICHKEFYPKYFNEHSNKVIGCHWEFIDESVYYPVDNLEDIVKYINRTRNLIGSWIPEDKRKNRDIKKQTSTSKTTSKNISQKTTITTVPNTTKKTSTLSQNPGLKTKPKRPETIQNQPIENKSNNKTSQKINQKSNQNQDIANWREAWYSPKVEIWARFAEDGKSKAVHWFHGEYKGKYTIKNTELTGKMGRTGRIWHRMYPRFITNDKGKVVKGKGHVELLTIFPDNSSQTQRFLNFLTDESEFTRIW